MVQVGSFDGAAGDEGQRNVEGMAARRVGVLRGIEVVVVRKVGIRRCEWALAAD